MRSVRQDSIQRQACDQLCNVVAHQCHIGGTGLVGGGECIGKRAATQSGASVLADLGDEFRITHGFYKHSTNFLALDLLDEPCHLLGPGLGLCAADSINATKPEIETTPIRLVHWLLLRQNPEYQQDPRFVANRRDGVQTVLSVAEQHHSEIDAAESRLEGRFEPLAHSV